MTSYLGLRLGRRERYFECRDGWDRILGFVVEHIFWN